MARREKCMWIPRFLRRVFRINTETERLTIHATKYGLEMTLQSGWDTVTAQVPRESVDKLIVWLRQTYPDSHIVGSSTGANRFPQVIPIFRGKTYPGRGPGSPR